MPYRNYPVEVFEDLGQLMRASADRFAEKTAFLERAEDSPVEISFLEYKNRVEALGTALWARGLKGKRILLCGKNGSDWAIAYMAIVCGLGTAVPIDCTLSDEEIVSLADRADAEAIIAPARVLKRIAILRPTMRRVVFEDFSVLIAKGEKLLALGKSAYLNAQIDPTDVAAIHYTKGVSGRVVGVMLSHRSICFSLSEVCRMVEIREGDVFLSVIPLHHAYESILGFLCPFYRGAAVAFGGGLRALPRDLRLFRPTVLLCVPLLVQALYEHIWKHIRNKDLAKKTELAIKATDAIASENLRISAKRKAFSDVYAILGGRLRLLISSGDGCAPSVLSGLRALGISALQCYGVSECASLAAINRDQCFNDCSVGLATPSILIDVSPTQDDGVGEIRIKGDNVMIGYYNEPEATAAVLHDGWLYTGDLGYVDENGFLFITGRKKNVIVTPSGKSVSPEEIEARFNERLYVKESFVTLGKHHKTKKPAVVAVLVPDLDKIAESYGNNFTHAELELEMRRALAEVNAGLQKHKRVESYVVCTEPLPRNASKKLLREQIKRSLNGQ